VFIVCFYFTVVCDVLFVVILLLHQCAFVTFLRQYCTVLDGTEMVQVYTVKENSSVFSLIRMC